jgi:hypothetical protein
MLLKIPPWQVDVYLFFFLMVVCLVHMNVCINFESFVTTYGFKYMVPKFNANIKYKLSVGWLLNVRILNN